MYTLFQYFLPLLCCWCPFKVKCLFFPFLMIIFDNHFRKRIRITLSIPWDSLGMRSRPQYLQADSDQTYRPSSKKISLPDHQTIPLVGSFEIVVVWNPSLIFFCLLQPIFPHLHIFKKRLLLPKIVHRHSLLAFPQALPSFLGHSHIFYLLGEVKTPRINFCKIPKIIKYPFIFFEYLTTCNTWKWYCTDLKIKHSHLLKFNWYYWLGKIWLNIFFRNIRNRYVLLSVIKFSSGSRHALMLTERSQILHTILFRLWANCPLWRYLTRKSW